MTFNLWDPFEESNVRISWSDAPPLRYRELYCDLEDPKIVQFLCDKGPTRF